MHLIPGVTDRCVHITDMKLVRRGEHSFADEMTAADHQISIAKIDLLNGHGKEWQILLHMTHSPGQMLNRTGADRPARQPTASASAFTINKSRQNRLPIEVGQQAIQGLNHKLSTTRRSGGEPFMSESDAPGQRIGGRRHDH